MMVHNVFGDEWEEVARVRHDRDVLNLYVRTDLLKRLLDKLTEHTAVTEGESYDGKACS